MHILIYTVYIYIHIFQITKIADSKAVRHRAQAIGRHLAKPFSLNETWEKPWQTIGNHRKSAKQTNKNSLTKPFNIFSCWGKLYCFNWECGFWYGLNARHGHIEQLNDKKISTQQTWGVNHEPIECNRRAENCGFSRLIVIHFGNQAWQWESPCSWRFPMGKSSINGDMFH